MKATATALAVTMLLALSGLSAGIAQAGVTGVNAIQVPAQSDVTFTIPFTQAAVATYTIASKDADGIVVNPAPGAFDDAYYVRFISGGAEGLWITVDSVSGSEITLDGDTPAERTSILDLVSVGDTCRVYKHYTVASLFPKGMYSHSYNEDTTLFIYDNDTVAMGENKAAAASASYTLSAGGRWVGSGATRPLEPETRVVLRNGSDDALRLWTWGVVPDYTVSMLIGADGDLNIGSGYPVSVPLSSAGLGSDGRVLFFYDNAASGTNKAAQWSATYTTSGGGRWVGSGAGRSLKPSEAMTLRLPSDEAGNKVSITKPYP